LLHYLISFKVDAQNFMLMCDLLGQPRGTTMNDASPIHDEFQNQTKRSRIQINYYDMGGRSIHGRIGSED